jgi:uncharacterized membrane protein
LPGDDCGQAFAVNKHEHVVGYSSGRTRPKAFLWTRSERVRNLRILQGGDHSRARDLNDWDEVVGTSASAAGDRAVLWTKKAGTVRDLGTLPGDKSTEGVAINDDSDVVGNSKGLTNITALFCALKVMGWRGSESLRVEIRAWLWI